MEEKLKDLVRHFLLEFKQVAVQQGIDLVPRHDTRATLAYLGITQKNAEDIMLSLSVGNYFKGPTPDDQGRTGELWEFGTIVQGTEVYIKLKLAQINEEKIAKCISFHIPRYPIDYPFQD